MSSSYYVNALFSKYTAGAASLFQNAEPTSCSFATGSPRSGYGPGASAFASSMPALYNVNSPLYQSPFPSGYGLGSDAYNLHCASFDQNIPVLCNDLTKSSCEKAEESNLHSQAESNFRIYPWMRSSGRRQEAGAAVQATWGWTGLGTPPPPQPSAHAEQPGKNTSTRKSAPAVLLLLIRAEAPLRRKAGGIVCK